MSRTFEAVYEAEILNAAAEVNADLTSAEVNKGVYLFAAIHTVRPFNMELARHTAHWVVRFLLEFRAA